MTYHHRGALNHRVPGTLSPTPGVATPLRQPRLAAPHDQTRAWDRDGSGSCAPVSVCPPLTAGPPASRGQPRQQRGISTSHGGYTALPPDIICHNLAVRTLAVLPRRS